MKWLDRLARNQSNYAQARYNRAKGGSDAAMTALDYPQRRLKEAISGDPNTFGVPEFSYQGPVGKSGERVATYDQDAVEAVLDVVADPLNLVGAGVMKSGLNTARKIAGADSLRGNLLSSAPNYIDNFYGPSGAARPNVVDELLAERVGRIDTPQDAANLRERATSGAAWAGDAVRRGIEQTIDPSARALYRGQGINRTTQDVATQALESGSSRDIAKAVAQSQASGTLIPDQAGRVGRVSPDTRNIERRSYLTDPVPVTEGSYSSLVRENKLQGRYESGRSVSVSDKDLELIDDHINTVWKDARGVSVKDSPGATIRIKNPGAGDQVTGQHHFDFSRKSGVVASIKPLFKEGNLTEKQLWDRLSSRSEKNREFNKNIKRGQTPKWVLSQKSNTLEKAQENGFWVTGSFVGNAVTEGGVNYFAKVMPNGKVMAVISDEHNFLEKMPVVGDAITGALPNRSISVTPPMHFNLKGTGKKVKSEQPKDKVDVKESLFNIATAEPSKDLLAAERRVNRGAGIIGTGMLTGGNREERR
jgi:hypothetical protein